MFLSKKNAIYFNKPKKTDLNKARRILAGWEDEEEDKKDRYQHTQSKTQVKQSSNNLLLGDEFNNLTVQTQPKKESQSKFYLNWDQLNDKNDIQCEKRLVEQMVQTGGIRIKPNDSMLNDFLKEIKGMEAHIIGSLLLSKIEVNYPFQTKAKALYTVQFLAKKNQVYLSFFKAHVQKLKEFPQPEDNVENYKKVLKSTLSCIGVAAESSNIVSEQQKQKYVDPGYNDDPTFKMSNFIQQNSPKTKKTEIKKTIIGPGQAKQKVEVERKQPSNNDIFNLDLLGQGNLGNQQALKSGDIKQFSFQQMLGEISLTNKQPHKAVDNLNFLI